MSVCYPMLFRVFQHITSIVYRLWICIILCFFAFSSISLQLCTGYGYVLSYAFSRFPAYHFNCVPAMDMRYPMLFRVFQCITSIVFRLWICVILCFFAFSSVSLQLCTGYECVLSYAFSRFPAYHFNCVPAMDMCYPMLFRVFQHITSIVYRLWICVILCFFALDAIYAQSTFVGRSKISKGKVWTGESGILAGTHCLVGQKRDKYAARRLSSEEAQVTKRKKKACLSDETTTMLSWNCGHKFEESLHWGF